MNKSKNIDTFRILLFDRNKSDANFICDALRETSFYSFDIKVSDNLDKILVSFDDGMFDAIFFDFHSSSDEMDMIIKLKKRYFNIPIILMVDIDNEKEILHYLEAGADECIVKNEVNRNQLARYVFLTIKRHQKIKSLFERLNQLASVEETLRGIIEENTEPIIIVDVDGIVRFANHAAESLFGRNRKGLEGEMFEFSINPKRTIEIEITRPDNVKILLEMRTIPIEWQREIGYLVWLHNITGLVRIREELRAMALIDDLTGLFNQKGLILLGEQQLKLSNRTKRGMYIIYIDIIHLNDINKNYGPYEGDAALVDMASLLRNTFRKSDIIARIGDDEFIVFAIEAERNSGEAVCLRLINNINKFNSSGGRRYKLSINIKKLYYDPHSPISFDNLLEQIVGSN